MTLVEGLGQETGNIADEEASWSTRRFRPGIGPGSRRAPDYREEGSCSSIFSGGVDQGHGHQLYTPGIRGTPIRDVVLDPYGDR